jgi:asparagine synthase (glutamine-hydrolysing)
LTGLLPFTWPGWNYLYAVGDLRDGALPSGLGIYPYIQSKVYSADLISQIGEYDAFAQTEELGCQVAHLDPITRYQYLDTRQYLPDDILTKVDRMSMANSLEVRAPLLDYQVVEFMAALPLNYKIRDGVSKRILRQVCGRMLPASVLKKRKQGFALPKGQWFQKELRGAAEEILLDRKTLSRGYFRQDTLEQILRHQARGVRDYSTWIWCLMVLEIWHRLFFDDGPVGLSGQAVTNQKTASPFPGSYRA